MNRKIAMLAFLIHLGLGLSAFQKSQPEVLIVGTMHQVPKVVKNSYRPLLKAAKNYEPDAIYVERQRADDSLSLANYESEWFLPFGDSIAKSFEVDEARFKGLMAMGLSEMDEEDFRFLSNYFALKRDKANWHYYDYLATYGLEGSRKPLRNENTDLTAPLAIARGMKRIFAMDHQHETATYQKLWRDCMRQSKKDGEIKYLNRAYTKDAILEVWPALVGRLGKFNQKEKTIRRYNLFNRFEFRKTACEPCDAAAAVWDRRNAGMAANIGHQMLQNGHQRAVVIVGAGHLLGIQDELKKQFPQFKIRLITDKNVDL